MAARPNLKKIIKSETAEESKTNNDSNKKDETYVVVVLSDSEAIIDLAKKSSKWFKVYIAKSVNSAKSKIKKHQPDAVVLDVKDSEDVDSIIKTLTEECLTLTAFLTTSTGVGEETHTIAAKKNCHITDTVYKIEKPQELYRAIITAIDRCQILKENEFYKKVIKSLVSSKYDNFKKLDTQPTTLHNHDVNNDDLLPRLIDFKNSIRK